MSYIKSLPVFVWLRILFLIKHNYPYNMPIAINNQLRNSVIFRNTGYSIPRNAIKCQ